MQNYMLVPQQGVEPADEWIRLGVEAQMANRLPDAERHYRHALRIDPRNAVATLDFAILYAQQGNLNEALLTIERAAIFDPTRAVIKMNQALMLFDADRVDEALEAGYKAVEIASSKKPSAPDDIANTQLALALIMATAGLAQEAIPLYNNMLDLRHDHPLAGPNCCFIQTLAKCTPEDLLRQRKRWYDGNRYKGEKKPHKVNRSWPRPLRVGYVGGDFKTHSAAMIFGNVIFNHDHQNVLPFLYSNTPVNPDADYMTKKFRDIAGDRWREIFAKNDEEVEEMVRDDKIDILVDLAAHTNANRLAVFTRKAAPVQITAWGFAHGTGVPEIDWFLADPIAIPTEERKHFAEKIYDLPCLVTYSPPPYILKEGGMIPFQQNGFITFGSSARYEKLSAECLGLFSRILQEVPDSVLRLKDNAYRRPDAIRRVMKLMSDINPDRLHFLIGTTHDEHMIAYRSADIALDPFPHGGGVVALEQLYMGLPIITRYGTQPSGRNTASVLTAMGRKDWVAYSDDEYVEKAVALSDDTKTLRAAHKSLRTELLESPVVKGYCEAVESAYQDIWEKFIGVSRDDRLLEAAE